MIATFIIIEIVLISWIWCDEISKFLFGNQKNIFKP